MHNIQDLKDRIFSESKNIISILGKIEHVNELAEKQDLVNELAEKISFLTLLNQKIEYYSTDDFHSEEMLEEEAIFNNQLSEIAGSELKGFTSEVVEEEAIFNNQLNEIVESELHDTVVHFAEEIEDELSTDDFSEGNKSAENQWIDNGIGDSENIIEEEAIFNNQLNEIDEFENEISENKSVVDHTFGEEEKIQYDFENNEVEQTIIPTIFDAEHPEEELLIEENESLYKNSFEEGEMMSETSNVDQIIAEIKHDKPEESAETETVNEERGKIVDFEEKNVEENEEHASDRSFEDLEKYRQEKKIKLAHIRGLKTIQSLFDDDPLEREVVPNAEIVDIPVKNEESGGILKANVPTDFMEAEKEKPQFKLDLNDRIAFSKTLFGGSQSELNDVVNNLNSFKNVDDAKEYLSDLYYAKKWDKVDEYAQRLWILVENRFS